MAKAKAQTREAHLELFEARRNSDGESLYLTKDQGLAVLQAHPDRQFLLIPEHISPNHIGFFDPEDQCTLQTARYSCSGRIPYTELGIEEFEILGRPSTIPTK